MEKLLTWSLEFKRKIFRVLLLFFSSNISSKLPLNSSTFSLCVGGTIFGIPPHLNRAHLSSNELHVIELVISQSVGKILGQYQPHTFITHTRSIRQSINNLSKKVYWSISYTRKQYRIIFQSF